MIQKSKDLIVIPCSDDDLDQVLREAGIAPDAEARRQLAEGLKNLQDHPLNAGKAKPSVVVPGVNVHFRLVPTLYTALITTIGVAVAIATLPASPAIAAASAGLAGANAIKDVVHLFNKLNAQEVAVVNALSTAIAERRNTDSKAKDATAAQVEATFKGQGKPPAVEKTLQLLVSKEVVSEDARDGDIYYALR